MHHEVWHPSDTTILTFPHSKACSSQNQFQFRRLNANTFRPRQFLPGPGRPCGRSFPSCSSSDKEMNGWMNQLKESHKFCINAASCKEHLHVTNHVPFWNVLPSLCEQQLQQKHARSKNKINARVKHCCCLTRPWLEWVNFFLLGTWNHWKNVN